MSPEAARGLVVVLVCLEPGIEFVCDGSEVLTTRGAFRNPVVGSGTNLVDCLPYECLNHVVGLGSLHVVAPVLDESTFVDEVIGGQTLVLIYLEGHLEELALLE